MTDQTFRDLALSPALVRATEEEGYTTPTPIQVKAIPPVLAGRDVLGCAQTGTGKTAAFALPILDRLAQIPRPVARSRAPRVLVLSPTRELATQIGESFITYGRHAPVRCAVITGGVGQGRQTDTLDRGVDVLVACPGRLLDLVSQRLVSLGEVEIFVLDEADRMLDMGFLPDVKRIIAQVPKKRQTLLFSATMPESIRDLAHSMLIDPIEVAVAKISEPAETVDQVVYFVEKGDKRRLLGWVLEDPKVDRAIVFTRTKHGANRVVENLEKDGVSAAAIHGNKSQNARERALAGFKEGKIRVLVATDIAARGIDIDGLSHVINFELPNIAETYVHRIGRTGRAGAEGRALSFCDAEEREFLVDIERLLGRSLPAITNHPHPSPLGLPPPVDLTRRRRPEPSSSRGPSRGPSRDGGGGGGGGGGRRGGGGHGPSHSNRPREGGGPTVHTLRSPAGGGGGGGSGGGHRGEGPRQPQGHRGDARAPQQHRSEPRSPQAPRADGPRPDSDPMRRRGR